MIHKIRIENFQSHENTELKLDPGVNMIVGPSDSGKTAILRALRWVLTNKPTGDAFRSFWGGKTEAHIITEEAVVARIKDKNKLNEYRTDDPHFGEQTFKAFGQGVPDEVLALLGIAEVNLQQQHDAHFLLSESSADVAKILNRAANLEVIDSVMAAVNKLGLQTNSSIRQSKADLEGKEAQAERFVGLEKLHGRAGALVQMERQSKAHRTQARQLLEMAGRVEKTQRAIARMAVMADLDVSTPIKQADEAEALYTEAEELVGLSAQVLAKTKKLKRTEQLLALQDPVLEALKKAELASSIRKTARELDKLLILVAGYERQFNGAETAIQAAEVLFDELMPDTCPLCGRG